MGTGMSVSSNKKLNYLTWRMHKDLNADEVKRWAKGAFYNLVGYMPNLKNPKTFNEKILWYRLNYDSLDLRRSVDKVEFKSYIKEKIGEGYTAELYGVWSDEEDFTFDDLPKSFVLKSTFSSASENIIFVDNKDKINRNELLYEMTEWLQPWNSSSKSFSNWYENSTPRIMAEEYLECTTGALVDYKIMCFNGTPKCLFTVSDRFKEKYLDFYDLAWNRLPFKRKFQCSPYPSPPPKNLSQMIEIAKLLSKPFPFVRVDFYEIGDKLYVGELTFSPGGGFEPFSPAEWDKKLGDWLELPI
ncbi:glycosyl transferase [Aliidiomarina minuta]|uniref:Glycosyl transferase n=1 Tax=Aliidiomarina minuta TaxID=880057 RepID=A0A432W835_9GAMM|nr:ATP-grasp fold amidoligase family protein [Aliidiomarina minuta]RUO26270.1 glycosyl transferase [Aliidiomarina minuta]